MELQSMPGRDLATISLPKRGRVREVDGPVLWQIEGDDGRLIEPVQRYFRDLATQGKAGGTLRSYGYDLLKWWRFLIAVDVAWDRATSAESRDFVLWALQSAKPIARHRNRKWNALSSRWPRADPAR